jgi:arylsulfatase A
MLPKLTRAAVDFINGRKGNAEPFFLYVPWSAPHSPVAPSPEWKGKSGMNDHADFVMQTDDSYGQIMNALKENGLLENTLVICTADNGTSAPTANMKKLQSLGHFSSGDLRGSKADIWDGGHRVPFLVSWPGSILPGSQCTELVCLTDVIATVADLLDVELPENAAEDSFSFLPAMSAQPGHARDHVIHHSNLGYFAIRQGNWKLASCPGSGGWSDPKPNAALWEKTKADGMPMVQLYDMSQDIGEQKNLASDYPEKVTELRGTLDRLISAGRSTPGNQQSNDAKIIVDKRPPNGKANGDE